MKHARFNAQSKETRQPCEQSEYEVEKTEEGGGWRGDQKDVMRWVRGEGSKRQDEGMLPTQRCARWMVSRNQYFCVGIEIRQHDQAQLWWLTALEHVERVCVGEEGEGDKKAGAEMAQRG